MKLRLWASSLLICSSLLAAGACAQAYPTQRIRAVVGYGAGGGADTMIRAVVQELSEALGQQVVVDNRPGAGTIVGTQIVATSKPDGYTVLVADNAFTVNPFLGPKLPYDSQRDFVPIVAIASSSSTLLVVHPSLPVRTVKEFVALAKSRPGQIAYASGGNGTIPHLLAEMLKAEAKIDLPHVPYKSTAAAIFASTSGEVPAAFGGLFALRSLVDSARLRPIAIASGARHPVLPDVPTFAEAGWPAIEATSYRGLLAPAGTPREAIQRLNAETNKLLKLTQVRSRMSDLWLTPVGGTPEDYGRLIREEMDKWGKVIRAAGIKAE
jgi:tripartite-type tricarboxylate transporter receptor subunit TctC